MGGVLIFADGLEIVTELGVLHQPGDQDGDDGDDQADVIERYLGRKVGDDRFADLECRNLGNQNPLGAVGETLEVHGAEPHDFSDGNGGQDEIRSAQAEADGADDQRDHQGDADTGQCPVPGENLLVLQQDHGGVGAGAEVGGVAYRVLTGVAADHVPGLAHDHGEENQDHDVQGVGALHKVGKEKEGCQDCQPENDGNR